VVKSSVGHIRDRPVSGSGKKVDPKARAKAAAKTRKMPPGKREKHKKEQAKRALFARMGINPEKDWDANYEILPGKEKVVNYLATDLDREGEAISWHIYEILKDKKLADKIPFYRVEFSEITKHAIQDAVANPRELSMDLVNAQQARRALDHLVGFTLSPLLWKKIKPGLSAGRVQSPALRMIVEREREIEAFNAQEYWTIEADLQKSEHAFTANLVRLNGDKYRQFDIQDEKRANCSTQTTDCRCQWSAQSRQDHPQRTQTTAGTTLHYLYIAAGRLAKTQVFGTKNHAHSANTV